MDDQAVDRRSDKLLSEGFSEKEVMALASLRKRIEEHPGADLPPEYKRLKFARWLVEHDGLHI